MIANDAGHLRKEDVTEIEKIGKRAPDLDLSYSRVFAPFQMTNPNAEEGSYEVLTDTGSAHLLRNGSQFKKLKINGSKVTFTLDDVGIGYGIKKTDIQNASMFSRPLNLEYVERAKRATDEKINAICYRGDTEFGEFLGVLELVGLTTYSGTALSTASLNIVNEVINAVQGIPVRYRQKSYSLVVADQEHKFFTKIQDNSSNASIADLIQRAIPNVTVVLDTEIASGGALASGGTIASGTALLIPREVTLCRLPIAQPVKSVIDTNTQSNPALKKLEGQVEGKLGPVGVIFPTSLVKITGWA